MRFPLVAVLTASPLFFTQTLQVDDAATAIARQKTAAESHW
jgi:hypothetical protein